MGFAKRLDDGSASRAEGDDVLVAEGEVMIRGADEPRLLRENPVGR
jgi:hypothetical protein